MEKTFWQKKWTANEIGFHESDTNPFLLRYFSDLNLNVGDCILLPLCGKTLDIRWLLKQGIKVIGVELIETAVQQLFAELNVEPIIVETDELKCYSHEHLTVWVGDVFSVRKEHLEKVDAVYDRAALVALPEDVRLQYAKHIQTISEDAPQLLITFEYDQTQIPGPPFAISRNEVAILYDRYAEQKLLCSETLIGDLKGKVEANETVWLMR